MNGEKNQNHFLVCTLCSHPIPFDPNKKDGARCERCGEESKILTPKSAELTLIFSLTALIFYVPANLFPFMTVELYGRRNSSTIWNGIVSLANDGAWAIALIVFLASMIIPLLKLVALFYLSASARLDDNSKFKTQLYRVVEVIGRWSMLDIFILSVLVTVMKLGRWTTVEPEIGSLMFLLVVIFTMLASAQFDPQLLWRKSDDSQSK